MKQAVNKVLNFIRSHPGLLTSQIVERFKNSRLVIEDAIWELWKDGKIQIDPNSTLRITRYNEKVFRYFYP